MATHSSILAWEILWTKEPGGQQSTESQKSWTQLTDQTTMKLDFIKIKNFCASEDTLRKWKDSSQRRRKHLQIIPLRDLYLEYIEFLNSIKRQIAHLKKASEQTFFPPEDIQIANKPIKNAQQLVSREIKSRPCEIDHFYLPEWLESKR